MSARTTSTDRNRLIAAIQTARRTVDGMEEDEAWRDWLVKTVKVRSLRDMSEAHLKTVLIALNRLNGRGGRPRYFNDQQTRMIRGLWLEAAEAGVIRDRSENALSAFVRRQTRQDIGQLSARKAAAVIEALKAMIGRAAAGEGGHHAG
jgi:phage gp16-like protein